MTIFHTIAFLLVLNFNVTIGLDESTLCPYTEYCTRGPTMIKRRDQSCCQPCSCSDLCGLVGACCPDKVIKNKTIAQDLYPCLTQSSIYHKYLNISGRPNNKGARFRVVTRCHVHSNLDNINRDMKEHISRCLKAESVEDLIIVTSTTSGITYQNKHCAICNEDTDYRDWSIYITAKSELETISSFEERDKAILTNGGVTCFPSEENDLQLALCFDHVIRQCNDSHKWDLYDREIEKKCEKSQNLFYKPDGPLLRVYKNVFCYLCDSEMSTQVEHTCKNILMKYEFSYSNFVSKTIFENSLIALLVLPKSNYKKSEITIQNTMTCNETETTDPLHNRCVKLFCPIGSIQLNGTCRVIYEDLIGLSVTVLFNFTLDEGFDRSRIGLKPLLVEMVSYMQDYLDGETTNCQICEGNFFKYPFDKIGFMFIVRSSLNCSHLHYMGRLANLFNQDQFSIYSNYLNMYVNFSGLSKYDVPLNKAEFVVSLDQFTVCKTKLFFSKQIVYCPSIELPVSDIKSLDLRLKEKLLLNSTKIGNDIARICLSDLKRTIRMTSSSSSREEVNAIVAVYFMIFNMAAWRRIKN